MTPTAAAARAAVQTRNATEEAILEAARDVIDSQGFHALTMEAIARRAFVSRTAVYFYFANKRAVVDRLIQQAFSEMYLAASPYLDGEGDDVRESLREAITRVVVVVNRHGSLLLLAAQLAGSRGEHLPPEWAPHIRRFVEGAQARIERDQRNGSAPSDIPADVAAQALLAMVESHIVREVVLRGSDAHRAIIVLAELWYRAVYALGSDASAP